ncbi:MAG: O-antigen polymerase [Bacteroidota bacterium]|jgi:oligosaccharide repeat unit polymerase
MSLLFVGIIIFFGIVGGKKFFGCWFNHLTAYSLSMGMLTFFYELKLLPYPDLIILAWFFIVGSSVSFIFGILTVISARSLRGETYSPRQTTVSLPIFADKGKVLKYSAIFFSFIGLFVAIQRWYVLIKMFGSIPAVFLNAALIYHLNVRGEIKEFIPFLPSFIYVGVFLAAIYTAYKGKFSFLSFFPLICVVLKELTYFGRGEMLLSTMEFFFTFFLMRNLLKHDSLQRFKFLKTNAFAAGALFIVFIIISSSFVRVAKGAKENIPGTSKVLKDLQGSMILTPTVYLYLSSDVGVFSKYLELEKEDAKFGENSFRIVYEFLSKLKVAEEPPFFQKGYHIPMWTNTGTYLRELHADYGVVGVFLVPYLLGLIITFLWFIFYEKNSLIILTVLVYLYLVVGFSFLVIVTRLNQWFFSQILIIAYLPILEKMATRTKPQL